MKTRITLLLILITLASGLTAQTYTSTNSRTNYVMGKHRSSFSYGDMVLSRHQFETFIQENCPQAYTQYKKGNNLIYFGIGMTSIGVVSAGIGTFLALASEHYRIPGYAFIGIGGAMTIAGIPICAVGGTKRDKEAISVFNDLCAHRYQDSRNYSLYISVQDNGVGMGLNF